MSQPANAPIRAPSATWRPWSEVCAGRPPCGLTLARGTDGDRSRAAPGRRAGRRACYRSLRKSGISSASSGISKLLALGLRPAPAGGRCSAVAAGRAGAAGGLARRRARGGRSAAASASSAGASPPSKPVAMTVTRIVVAGVLVDDRAEDDVAVVVRGLADDPRGLVDLEQAEVGAAGDVEQHAGGAGDGRLEQRRRDRRLRGLAPRGSRRRRCRCPSATRRRPA